MTAFRAAYDKAFEQFEQFVNAADDEDLTDAEQEEAMIGLVCAAGGVLFGIWNELRRIADAVNHGSVEV